VAFVLHEVLMVGASAVRVGCQQWGVSMRCAQGFVKRSPKRRVLGPAMPPVSRYR
jgi:hypothetical protein